MHVWHEPGPVPYVSFNTDGIAPRPRGPEQVCRKEALPQGPVPVSAYFAGGVSRPRWSSSQGDPWPSAHQVPAPPLLLTPWTRPRDSWRALFPRSPLDHGSTIGCRHRPARSRAIQALRLVAQLNNHRPIHTLGQAAPLGPTSPAPAQSPTGSRRDQLSSLEVHDPGRSRRGGRGSAPGRPRWLAACGAAGPARGADGLRHRLA